MTNVWAALHDKYKGENWLYKPSIFAETVVPHFPKTGSILELGAGQGQDSRYFAELGYQVTSTDIEQSALDIASSRTDKTITETISYQPLDLRQPFPFPSSSFDVVYAHLSLHYFSYQATTEIFDEIKRVLKEGGLLATLVNSKQDPEFGKGVMLEADCYQADGKTKRFFDTTSLATLTSDFDSILLDNSGESYKDNEKGVHNLIRFIGKK